MKSHSKRILSLVFALLMAFQQVMFAAQTVDLLTPAEQTQTVDLLTGEEENKTVDLLTPAESSAPIEQPIEQSKPIIEENKVNENQNENQTVDLLTPGDDEVVPEEGKKSTTTILIGGEEEEETQDDSWDLTPAEITVPEENHDEEEKKDATFEDEEHHENAGALPWSTDLVKPWSIYREPKKVYRPGEDLDLTELLVEIKTGRSGSLYNIEDLINDEFTTITRTRKSDGEKVRLDDKIYEDETMTIHMDGCQDLTIDFIVDENLKDEEEALEAFQDNLIREEFRDGLDFSLYLIKKGERVNPIVAYSLDPHKLTPIGNGVDKKLKDGPLFDLKDINTWDRFDIETLGKVKAILERSAEIKNTENVRKKLITQLAIWNVTSNIIPREIDATVSEIEETETTDFGPELKPTDEEEIPEEKEEEPIEIIDPTTPEEEIESVEQDEEVETVEEKTEIEKTEAEEKAEIEEKTETEEPAEEKTEAEEPVEENTQENKESEKIEELAPVQSTVHKIVFDVREIDVPYNEVELSDEEYALYNELTSLEAIELKSEDEDLKIYEPTIEETENPYADLVTIGESDIDSIERVETEVTFDAVDYSFQNLYHTLETSSMLGFGQPRDFNVLLKATMKASRKIVEGDKFEVEILSKTLPILNGEEGRANDIQIDGKVVATAEYIAEEHKIVYTFVEDLDTDKVEIEQEFKQIKEEKAALLNMLDVSENLILDAVRGAEGAEEAEENPDELEISPEFEENLIQLKLGNTPVQYNGVSFETKKFRLKTTMTAKAAPVWKIPKDWTFDVNIGPYLKPEYDENSEPILKPLYDPNYPGKEIATPSYIENEDGHIIRYTFNNSITETKKLDIDQLLAFDTEAIGDKDKINIDITVKPKDNPTQKMQPIIVRRDDPRTVIPSIFEIDVNGNGEPNFNDTYEFFEYGPSYKVTFDAKSTPVVENRKMTAIDWEITFDGNGRKLGEEDLKLITNFTAVENSGIENIENVKLNGQPVTNLESNFSNGFLINDSKNVVGKQSADKYVFTFTTPVEKQQQAYVLDISAKLKGINKTGAVRLFQPYIDTIDLSYESPTILKCSNRVTNSGEFLSENKIRWILTEEVSSGDAGKLPVATRTLSSNQQIESSKVAYYILNNVDGNKEDGNKDDGKMQKVGETLDLDKNILEEGKLKEGETFAPGTIAVYEIITTVADQGFDTPNYYSFGDNVISLYRDYDVNIKWTSQVEGEKFPEETLYLKEKKVENEQIYYGHTYETVVKAQEDGEELNPDGKISKVENVKKWRIVNGKPEEIKYELSQKFGNESAKYRGIEYKELTNSFNIYDKRYEILNTIAKKGEFKTANITVLKRDALDAEKKLAGAKFSLIGDGSKGISYSGVTDIDGKIAFNDVAPGTYVLHEEMAPEGYRINRQQDIVTVDDKGNVKWTKNNIKTENIELPYDVDGKFATECLYHNGSPDFYPSYMNAMSYATVKGKEINYYIYLKPDSRSSGNGTDQNTILAINYDNHISKEGGLYNIPVKIYDVNPNNRAVVQEAFKKKEIEKTFNSIIPEGKLSHSNYSIVPGNTKINNSKFSLSIPKERFAGDWGFVLKFTLKQNNQNLDSNLWYNWVTDFNHNDSNGILDNESGYKKTFIPKVADRKSGEGLANSPELLIYNEQKDSYPIVVVTKDDERKILSNVELTLIDKSTNNIIRVGRTDKEGVCKFENVPEGEYLLKETEVPNGLSKYNLNYNITVNHDGSIKYSVTDEAGKPVEPGEKYIIGIIQDPTAAEEGQKPEIKVLENSMKLNETSGWGQKRGVWEENKYEAYDFSASFLINNSKAGEEIVIDFDDNWNVTQWSGSMPNIVTRDGHVVATAELDTNTNKLTYTLTDYVNGKSAINASLFIQSIRPSKYYVLTDKNPDGTTKKYEFNDEIITPTESVSQKTIVEPDLGPYFGEIADNSPLFITQNVDVTRVGKDLELRNVTVFNPDGKKNLVSDELYIYYGMTNEARVAEDSNRIEPAYKPKKIVVYKVNKKGNNPNRILLPVNGGIKPAENQDIYKNIAEFNITEADIRNGKEFTANEVSLSYKESRVDIKTNKVPRLNEKENVQFIFKFKDVDSGAGYVIEEFYDVTDEPAFRNNYILTSTYYHSKWGNKGGIAQMKPKSNAASADDGIIIDSGDPNKDLTIFHYRNKNRFIVKKVNDKAEPLANAWFTLKDENGNLIKEDSSNTNGIIVFDNLKPGTYYLTESVAPNGYSKLDKTVTVIVKENGTVEFTGDKDPNIEIISGSKTTKKYKKIYKEQKFEQPLTQQSRFPNFMNISSKILKNSSKIFNDNADFVTSRIYLNQLDNSTSGKGPDKDTKLFLNASYAKSTDITLYKIPKTEKGNIDGYIANTPSAKIDLTNNSEVKKMTDGSIWFRGPEDSRWNGDGYVIDITAKYGELKYEPGQRKEVDRVVDYTWIYEKDNTFVRGRVGVKSILSSLELADQTQTGDDIYEVPENDGAVIQVTNKPDKAKVTIVKVDEDNPEQKLSGAVFKLLDKDGKEILKEATTGKDGKATFEDLEPGTYKIIEGSAPKGYELTNKTWTVVVGKDNTVEVTENSKVSKTVFGIDNPDTTAIGTWNFTYYQKHVLDVSPVIEKSGDGYVVNVNTKGTSYSNDDRYSQLNMYFDTEHFEFEDTSIKQYDWFGKYVYFNSAPNTYSFKFKPKANVELGSYKPITGITYVNFPMSHEFLPTFNVKMSDGQTESNKVEFNKDPNEFSFNVSNKYKGYEVEFEKIGNDNGKEVLLPGAKFKLQIKDRENYVDFNPVHTAISDAKGKIKFSGLKSGEYKVVETDPPAGYYVLNKEVKFFKIDDDGNVFIMENGEYKPQTAKNKKILNNKPGSGKFKIVKTDGKGKFLEGVIFHLYNSRGDLVGEFTTDEKGEINFENLPFDRYTLREFETLPGYILDKEERIILIGEQFKVPENVNGSDVSKFLKLNIADSTIVSSNGTDTVKPNKGELISVNLKYNILSENDIKPGDTFTLVTKSGNVDNVDLDSISRVPDYKYDIYGPAGRLAAAKIGKDRKSITYTFTEYLESAKLTDLNIGMLLAVNRFTVKNSGKINVAIDFKDSVDSVNKFNQEINVDYTYFKDYDLNGCLVKYIDGSLENPKQKDTFRVIYYIKNHRFRDTNSYGKNLEIYSDDINFKIDEVKAYKVEGGIKTIPWSFGLNLTANQNDTEYGLKWVGNYFYEYPQNSGKYIINLNPDDLDKSEYVVEVKGTVKNLNDKPFTLKCQYNRVYRKFDENNNYYDTPIYEVATVFKRKEETSSSAATKFTLSVPNYKNKIEYTKVDGSIAGTADDKKPQGASQGSNEPIETPKPVFSSEGKALAGVKFQLQKKNASGEFKNYGKQKESDTNGKFSWEGLPEGEYQVVEIGTLPGYSEPKNPVSTFKVNAKGEIVDIKDNTTIIINEKIKPNIEFNKIDGRDKTPLKYAEFTLYKAKVENGSPVIDGDSLKFEVVNREVEESGTEVDKPYTVKSDENGHFEFRKLEDGIYAVKETKEPDGYIRFKNYVFYFKVEGTKIYRVNKLGDYIDDTKDKNKVSEAEKDEKSLIVNMENDIAQVNPIEIKNFKAEYPSTGGVGALPFVFIGMMIMMVGAYMFIRRRDALYE